MTKSLKGEGGLEGLIYLGILFLVGWGIGSIFGVSFGVENEGTVTYDDCRQTITIKDKSWKTYVNQFTCSYQKTESGKIMSGECVHIVNDRSLFSSSHTCATAYVYEKKSEIKCSKDYSYLGYDGKCYSEWNYGRVNVYTEPNTN